MPLKINPLNSHPIIFAYIHWVFVSLRARFQSSASNIKHRLFARFHVLCF